MMMAPSKLACWLLATLLLEYITLSESSVNGWTIRSYPDPQRDVSSCGRGKPSWVCDPDNVLTTREADLIDEEIEELRRTTAPCICYDDDDDDDDDHCPYDYGGFQPAVAIVDKMYFSRTPSSHDKREAAEDFAETLRDEYWEFGLCNDDFVIFLSRDDRQVYTAVGDEARSVVSDVCSDTIFEENKKYFSDGDYGTGIRNMIIDFRQVFQLKHTCQGTKSNEMYGIIAAVIVFVILVVCAYGIWRQRGKASSSSDSAAYKPGHEAHYSTDHHSHHSRKSSASSIESGGGGGGF